MTHHFSTRDALVDAALRHALVREVSRLQVFTLNLQSKAFDLEAWIRSLVNWYARDLTTRAEIHIACYEAFLAAATHARHRVTLLK